jgi:1-acyl-sn-glycerol-3-phosphate acyltransferase
LTQLYLTLCSIWSWFVLAACLLLWLPLMAVVRLVTFTFDPGRYWVGLLFRKVAVVMATLNPLWTFRISGVMPADPRRPFVAVSNHESFADILLLSHLPWEMKWLSKAELFRIPLLGWLMRLAGDIPVQRGTARSAVAAMIRCRETLTRNVSVIIFPEGTRTETDEMLPFKDGAFRLAIDCQVPILPMVVSGTGTALRKHDWRLGPSVAEVRVLEPVETTGMQHGDIARLRDAVREMIRREREAMRAGNREQGTGNGQ